MVTDPPFRESRRDPTDRRSWRQTPVFVGDVAAHVEKPRWTMFVTGVLPRGHVEVVNTQRLRAALITPTELNDIQQALADGRILPRSMPRRKLAPLTEGMAPRLLDEYGDPDPEVPS